MSPRVGNLPGPGKRAALGRLCGLERGAADRGERMLWLSGDGYGAALFHLGALTRLNELGLLGQVGTVGAVSGGSIAAAVLATRAGWPFQGACADWPERVAEPLRELAGGGGPAAIATQRRPFPGTAGEAALEERFARELLGASDGGAGRGPRFVFGASGLALSGITGEWDECLAWEIDGQLGAGYSPGLTATVLAGLPGGLERLGEAERAVLENQGYLLADSAARSQEVSGAARASEPVPPHPRWMDEEKVRTALAIGGRAARPRRLHLRSRRHEPAREVPPRAG